MLEFLRWALDQMPDQRTSTSLRKNIEQLVQAHLGNGIVEVEIQTDVGLCYPLAVFINIDDRRTHAAFR